MEQPVIAPTARKHGVSDDKILHAFNNPIRTEQLDEDMTMLIGPPHSEDRECPVGVLNDP